MVLSLVVVWTETVRVCTYQLFCSPTTETASVEGMLPEEVRVITSSCEFCWFCEQLVVTAEALVVQEKPEMRESPVGRVSNSLSRE